MLAALQQGVVYAQAGRLCSRGLQGVEQEERPECGTGGAVLQLLEGRCSLLCPQEGIAEEGHHAVRAAITGSNAPAAAAARYHPGWYLDCC